MAGLVCILQECLYDERQRKDKKWLQIKGDQRDMTSKLNG